MTQQLPGGSADARGHIEILDAMRGFAALAVAWYHFTHGGSLAVLEPLKSTGTYGWLGVEVFFVISGFIIPYAMYRGGYEGVRSFGRFFAKRLLRLEPPYLAAIVLTLVLAYASAAMPGFRGSPPAVTWPQVLLHLGYMNAFFGYPWLNPVFWTLAVEFQFYLFAALAYRCYAHASPVPRFALIAAMCACAYLLPNRAFVVAYMGLFALGLLAFYKFSGWLRAGPFTLLCVLVALATAGALDVPSATVGLVAALTIAFVRIRRNAVLAFLGAVSYSLYLLHVPIGGRVVNLGSRFADSLGAQALVLCAALAASLAASWVMYRLVELPARRWSSAVRYSAASSATERDDVGSAAVHHAGAQRRP